MSNKELYLVVTSLLLFAMVNCDEVYEPSNNLCSRCTCSRPTTDNRTLILDCSKDNMDHTLANWPPNIDHLVATFSGNEIKTLQQMPQTDASIALSFDHCGIESLESALFVDASNIEYLDLSWNNLPGEEIRADVFRGRYNATEYEPIGMKELNLAYNKIHSLGNKVFEHMPKLQRLNLKGNSMRIIDPSTSLALGTLRNLRVLNLAENQLKEVPDDALRHLYNLRELNLNDNSLGDVPISIMFVAKTLEKLSLSGNLISELTDESLVGLRTLRELNISNMTELARIEDNAFAQLESLRLFTCTRNVKLTHIDKAAFGELRLLWPVKEVYINDNALYSLSIDLMPWESLEVLDVTGNLLTCDCDMYMIAKRLPAGVKLDRSLHPTCAEPAWLAGETIYELTNDVCPNGNSTRHRTTRRSVTRSLRIALVSLSIFLAVALIAFGIGIRKYFSYKRAMQYLSYPVAYTRAPTSDRY